jgi:hypothetical protein
MAHNGTPQQYYDGDDFGHYQFVSLTDVINQFMLVYVGEDKIIPKAKRLDVAFHAQRALQELSYDTLKSHKAIEITVPSTLQMILPQDYVNYTKISWVDSSGIKHLLYPTSKTSNPSSNPLQDSNGNFTLQAIGTLDETSSTIVLDTEYKNIVVGMRVSSPNIPINSVVYSTSNSGGITTIQISNAVHTSGGLLTTTLATYTGTETLTFTNTNGTLILPQKSCFVLENVSYDLSTLTELDKLTVSISDAANIEVGMLVSHGSVPVGTTVTDVNGGVITISNIIDVTFPTATSITVTNDEFTFISPDKIDTDTWANYKSSKPSENQDDYIDNTYWPMNSGRYGLDPQHAQANGSFYMDEDSGKIHFSSNMSGKTIVLDYISDGLCVDCGEEVKIHKFAEEAMYKCISHAILAGKANIPEYQVNRLKKERFAAIRTAKLRLSNIKLEEITQVLRGKSKQIKH